MRNADITIYNKYVNTVTRLDEYKRTQIKGVMVVVSKGANIIKSGLSTADAVKIIIPFNPRTSKTYKAPKEWALVPNVDMGNYFTFQTGDKIVKGLIDYEIPAGTLAILEKTYDNVFTITTVDTCDFGSRALKHWEIGGA